MAKTKYGHLVKPLPFKPGPGGANAREFTWLYGKDLNGFEVNFAYGIYGQPGNWHSWAPGGGNGAHVHPYDEVLVFVGHNPKDLKDLGAELQVAMGKEQQILTFDKPSYVVVPGGIVHCPLITNKVTRPFSHFHIALGGEYKCTWLNLQEKPVKSWGKDWSGMLHTMPIKKGPGGANAIEIAWPRGEELHGLKLNFAWGLYNGLGDWENGRDPHVHPYDELLIFVGHNTDDLSYLGAEIEFYLGEEQEKHIINKSTVITVPKDMVHCPVITKKVDQPYSFFLISLDPKPQYKWLGKASK